MNSLYEKKIHKTVIIDWLLDISENISFLEKKIETRIFEMLTVFGEFMTLKVR